MRYTPLFQIEERETTHVITFSPELRAMLGANLEVVIQENEYICEGNYFVSASGQFGAVNAKAPLSGEVISAGQLPENGHWYMEVSVAIPELLLLLPEEPVPLEEE